MPFATPAFHAGRNIPDTRVILERGIGRQIPFKEMRAHRLAYASAFIEKHGVPIKRGMLGLLDLLEARSIPKVVATSTERVKAMEFLRHAGVVERFEFIVCGDKVSRGKPDPEIFLAAGRGVGVDAARCVVIEDSEAGIRAASAAGMIPLAVPDLRDLPEAVVALAHGVFSNLDEVASFLSPRFQNRV